MVLVELTLKAGAEAPSLAREAVRGWLAARSCAPATVDTAALLVTELVTNAVLHAPGPGLRLSIDETLSDVMRVAVSDESRRLPQRPGTAPGAEQIGGRGLWLVAALSASWGWEPLRGGKRVWFELPCRRER